MAETKPEAKKIKVKCHQDILTAIKPFIEDKGQLRESILEGFDLVKKRIMFNEVTSTGLDVDKMFFWVDSMIRDKLDGKRRGLFVVWKLHDGEFKFDPYSKEIKKVS